MAERFNEWSVNSGFNHTWFKSCYHPLQVQGLGKVAAFMNLSFSASKMGQGDFPGGAVVKNLPAKAGDTGLTPGPGRSHMPWSN